MTEDSDAKIEALFHAALDRNPVDRGAFLDEACKGDTALKQKVERLLASHDTSTHFLERPAWEMLERLETQGSEEAESLEPDPDLPMERLGEFKLIRRIGEGGMGVVYLAVQESLGRKTAVKVIQPDRIGSSETEARFWREVEAISDLRHNNIVTVYGSGKAEGVHYFAMEYVPGKRLDEYLREASAQGNKTSLKKILGWIEEIARALHCAHEAGIIHRDVKPSNIRLTPDEKPMLLDFGLARHADLMSLTLTGAFRGTPHYASPEQVKAMRGGIDARTDLYSLGVTLYEAVTGKIPFKGETTEQVFHQILEKEPPSPRSLDRSIPRDLETIILKAMEKDPAQRYQNMVEFADDLNRHARSESIRARPAGLAAKIWKRARKHPALSAAVGVALAALVVVAVILPIHFSDQASRRVLEDTRSVLRLAEEENRLWPADPKRIESMERWLAEATDLAGRLEFYRNELKQIRAEAQPREEKNQQLGDWTFNNPSIKTRHDTLAKLITGIEELTEAGAGSLARVQDLLAFTRIVRAQSIEQHLDDWKRAVESIADREECPFYDGLIIEPMLGLVPLGRDPVSRLWEFAHLQTGSVPERGSDGVLKIQEDSGLVLVLIPGGSFSMGARPPDDDHLEGSPNVDPLATERESPVHTVDMKPFLISKYEMSQGQWQKMTGVNPSHYKPYVNFGGKQNSLLHPIENVSWEESAFLLARIGLRLPSEAEWEYTARAGTTTPWWTGSRKETLEGAANLMDRACVEHQGATETPSAEWLYDGYVIHAPIHLFRANPFGLHNVCGNAYEWCEDAFHNNYDGAPADGSAWTDPAITIRVCRNACWDGTASPCRMSYRIWRDKDYRDCGLGLRPAASLESFHQ